MSYRANKDKKLADSNENKHEENEEELEMSASGSRCVPPLKYIEVGGVCISVWTQQTVAAALDKPNVDRTTQIDLPVSQANQFPHHRRKLDSVTPSTHTRHCAVQWLSG